MLKQDPKIVWSFKVRKDIKDWFRAYAEIRGTDPQEEVRRILADFREKNKHQILDKGYTGWSLSQPASS